MSFELTIIRQDFKILKEFHGNINSTASEKANQMLAMLRLATREQNR